LAFRQPKMNLLIHHWFDRPTAQACEFFLRRNIEFSQLPGVKDFAGELSDPYLLCAEGGEHVRFILKGEPTMAWKTPKIVEVPVGMEINMYACAARK